MSSTTSSLRDPKLLRDACYINGAWVKFSEAKTQSIYNPATRELVGNVPVGGELETRMAIESAQVAMREWSGLLASDRARLLRRWYDLIIENLDDLALILTSEQ